MERISNENLNEWNELLADQNGEYDIEINCRTLKMMVQELKSIRMFRDFACANMDARNNYRQQGFEPIEIRMTVNEKTWKYCQLLAIQEMIRVPAESIKCFSENRARISSMALQYALAEEIGNVVKSIKEGGW